MKRHEIEEFICDCGAGHGSLEGHVEWCRWVKLGPELFRRDELVMAAVEFLEAPGMFKRRVAGKMLTRAETAARLREQV